MKVVPTDGGTDVEVHGRAEMDIAVSNIPPAYAPLPVHLDVSF